jgi:NAD(P) transhydrogenase subunit alpha
MRIVVPAERRPGERRVAAVPDTVAGLTRAGHEVVVESGAGLGSLATDEDYREAGAQVSDGDVLADADVVLHVRPLLPDDTRRLRPGTVTLGFCSPSAEPDGVRALRDARVTAFAMELVPRISRAQSMDALTSQALVAGYRCVLEAAMRLPRFFPLFMTAAGTVPPAKVLVLGAGVAGLQAIATARRLGAVVEAYDVRPASADEVRSMGATFVQLDLEAIEGSGGYAREMAEDRARRQMELLAPYLAKADVVITTAAVPGRRAPLLVSRQMVEAMRPGSVVVDLAAESGGNVEGSVAGEELVVAGARLVGMADPASSMPVDASRLYAKNVSNLLALMVDKTALHLDLDDEVLAGACLTHDGVVRHAPTAEMLGDPPTPPADSPPPDAGPAAAVGSETVGTESVGTEQGDA